MTVENPWEDYIHNWPAVAGPEHHTAQDDIRRWLYLHIWGLTANAEAAAFVAQEPYSSENTITRFAGPFLNDDDECQILLPWGTTGAADFGQYYDTSTGGFAPGSKTVLHNGQFSNTILEVNDQNEFVFTGTLIEVYSIWGHATRYLTWATDPVADSWYKQYDDFRPGTPFIVSGFTAGPIVNNGFYRVRSRRLGTGDDAGLVFITVNDSNGVQQELYETTQATGTAACEFDAPDWYILRADNGHSTDSGGTINAFFTGEVDYGYVGASSGSWYRTADTYQRYKLQSGDDGSFVRGPNDGRPPDGGMLSAHFNKDWVRTQNPNLYHTYDKNSGRFYIFSETDGSHSASNYEQYATAIPTHKFLAEQCDPKEQVAPFAFEDTNRLHWKFKGKVPFKASQITNPDMLGAIDTFTEAGGDAGQSTAFGNCSAQQYISTHAVAYGPGTYSLEGALPNFNTGEGLSKWFNSKFDDALQNMVELACAKNNWCWPADTTYATNWIWTHWDSVIPSALQYELSGSYASEPNPIPTYGDWWSTYGTGLFNPLCEPLQTSYPSMQDEYWGENGSAFELILKFLGSDYYDWYYDEQHPYMSKTALDKRWVMQNAYDNGTWAGTYNGVYCADRAAAGAACYPYPVSVWRRVWKRTLDYKYRYNLRDGSRGEPSYSTYEYTDENGDTYRMVGKIVLTYDKTHSANNDEPVLSDFYTWTADTTGALSGAVLTLIGDQTAYFKTGWYVWAVVSAVKKLYPILKVTYDETNTVITFGGDFASDAPEDIYGDINLSSNHDAGYFANNEQPVYTDRIWEILNDCRSVLSYLQYSLDTLASITKVLTTVSGNVTYNCSYSPFPDPVPSFPTMQEVWQEAYDECKDAYDALEYHELGTSDTHNLNHYPGTVNEGYCLKNSVPTRYEVHANMTYHKFAIKVFNLLQQGQGRSLNLLVSARTITDPTDEETYVPGLSGPIDLECPEYNFMYYGFIALNTNTMLKHYNESTEDIEFYLPLQMNIPLGAGPLKFLFTTSGLFENSWSGDADFGLYYYIASNPEIMIEHDWAQYPEIIWYRTFERADYSLIDPYGPDTEPPKWVNAWVEEPILYDANFENARLYYGTEDNTSTNPYDYAEYTPEWHIRAESVLMEDLEGNGIEYIFDVSHTTYNTIADLMTRVQEERKYEEILDMNTGSDAGDSEDAWAAYDVMVEEWDFCLNSKDNAGDIGYPEQNDNYGTAVSAINIAINAPMFPIKPRIEEEKLQVPETTGTWYDHIWTDAPLTEDGPMQYCLEMWNTTTGAWVLLYDFEDTNPSPPSGGSSGNNHFYISGTPITDHTITGVSSNTYRIRYRNDSEINGMYSDSIIVN